MLVKNEEGCSGLLWMSLENGTRKFSEDLMLKIRNIWLKKTWKDILMELKLQLRYSHSRKFLLKMNKLGLVFMNVLHVSKVNVQKIDHLMP